jgi:hypothetical protein
MAAVPAGAAECRLALLLALDISASVDKREDELQRKGLARALLAPAVQDAFLADPEGPVWLSAYEWSGPNNNETLLEWFQITNAEDLSLAAGAIATSERSRDDLPTSLGYALGAAATRFHQGPACDRRTLDVSGDGRNNEGFPPESAYRAFDFGKIAVNALAIAGGEAGLTEYYRDHLISGPGAFVIVADGFRDYEAAMTRKLLRELQGPLMGMANR